MLTLFRIVELTSGSIEIDGLDIAKMGLADLRDKIAIIPQVNLRPLHPFTQVLKLPPLGRTPLQWHHSNEPRPLWSVRGLGLDRKSVV